MTENDPMQQANDMNEILAQAARVQAELEKAQKEILATTVEGTAGNGLVKAVSYTHLTLPTIYSV